MNDQLYWQKRQINNRNAVVLAGTNTCFLKRFQSFTESLPQQKKIEKKKISKVCTWIYQLKPWRSRSDGLLLEVEEGKNHRAHLVLKFQTSSQCSHLPVPNSKAVCVVCEGSMSVYSHVNKDFSSASKNIDVITVQLFMYLFIYFPSIISQLVLNIQKTAEPINKQVIELICQHWKANKQWSTMHKSEQRSLGLLIHTHNSVCTLTTKSLSSVFPSRNKNKKLSPNKKPTVQLNSQTYPDQTPSLSQISVHATQGAATLSQNQRRVSCSQFIIIHEFLYYGRWAE